MVSTSTASAPIKVAIIDDYQGIASAHFERLSKSGFEITVFKDTLLPYNDPKTPESIKQQLVDRLKPFTIISSMRERTPFPAALLHKLPNLKLLLNSGHRNASIDIAAAKELGIYVTGTGAGKGKSNASKGAAVVKKKGADSTTQHAVALILGIARNLAHDDAVMKNGGWQTVLATGLEGKVYGSVGLGRLGSGVAKIMHELFGMRVVAWSNSLTQEAADEKAREAGLPAEDEVGGKTFEVVGKEELFRLADVVSVHYVLSERSRGIVGAKDLGVMKKSALFINTSRGPLVDESALLDVLKAGGIRGAALDVYDLEPLPKDSQWRTTKWGVEGRSHVLLSPHMGYVEEDIMNAWYDEHVENIQRWHRGEELLCVLG